MLPSDQLLNKHVKSSSLCPYLFITCPYSLVKRFLDNTISRFTWPYAVYFNSDSRSFYQEYKLLSHNSKIRMTVFPLDRREVDEFTKDAENIISNNPKCNVKTTYTRNNIYKFIPSSCKEIRDLLNKYTTERY